MENILFLASKSSENIAKEIKSKVKESSIEIIEERQFLSSETYLNINSYLNDKKIYVVCDSFENKNKSIDENIFFALLIGYTAKIYGAKEINFIFPCFPYSRQDKFLINLNQSITLKFIITLLESITPKKILTFDIHNKSSFLGVNESQLINFDVEEVLFKEIISKKKEIVLLSTDFNGSKRVIEISKKYNLNYVLVGKLRNFSDSKKIDEQFIIGEIKNKNILIIDDMIDTGSTLFNLISTIKEKNPKDISVYISHGIFSNNSYEKLKKLIDKKIITKFYLANTLEKNKNKYNENNFIKIDVLNFFSKYINLNDFN